MSNEYFELIVKVPQSMVQETKHRLSAVLEGSCGCDVVEVEQLLANTSSLSLIRGEDSAQLEALSKEILSGGGKVLMVGRESESATNTVYTEIEITLPREQQKRSSFKDFFLKYTNDMARIMASLDPFAIEDLMKDMLTARDEDRQIFLIGNGGSAATASHMANDFAKQRFDDERSLFRIMSLTDNVSWITATANDVGYDAVFLNQLKNLMRPGDLVIAVSSSGNSENILCAVEYARKKGAQTWGIVGFGGGKLKEHADRIIDIPTKKGQYGYMEDITSIVNHMLSIYIYEQDRKRFA